MILTTFKSVKKAYVDHVINEDWRFLADLLTTHIDADEKHKVPLYNFAEFKSLDDPTVEPGRSYHGHFVQGEWFRIPEGTYDEIPNTIRRCKNNVVAINGIVLDVDDSMTIEQAQETYKQIEYVLYTTFRHTAAKNKFRVVIPFAQPLLVADIPHYQESIQETFPGVDSASFTVSQSFYFHSGLDNSFATWNEGIIRDPYKDFEYREQKIWHPAPTSNGPMDAEFAEAYKQAVLESLNTCSGLHYAGAGASNHAVLTLVSLCRSIGLGFEEYDRICARMAHTDSQLTNPSVRVAAWTGWDGDRVRRETRDAFIAAYGGKPINVKQVKRENYTETMAGIAYLEQLLGNKK
jgi:hypothetical protein